MRGASCKMTNLQKTLKKMQKTSKKGLTNEKEYGILIGRHGTGDFPRQAWILEN